mmetsp:Transcript_115601/g.331923  ORF Transcript_115601/g.331923 Transcript_115601/m.331923 type:complete len:409 (+) Transcript_115601:95-1321(+)
MGAKCCTANGEADKQLTSTADVLQRAEAVAVTGDGKGLGRSPVIDAPPVREFGQYIVTLDKLAGGGAPQPLGLDVDFMTDRRLLPIMSITGGLAEAWNRSAPEGSKLRAGDSIVEVNGVGKNVSVMLDKCKADPTVSLVVKKAMTFDNLVGDIEDLLTKKNCGPILIRLSWHDAGVFMQGAGGCPNGALRFPQSGEGRWAANSGLPTVALQLIANITKKYVPDLISHADLWALAANIAIRKMGGPEIPTRFGRADAASAADGVQNNEGRLPDGDKGADHLREVFGPKGFDDRAIVALSGAHTVGKCHPERSGFDGQWTEDHLKFDNSYFKDLINKTFTEEKTKEGKPQYRHAGSNTIMLKSDLALIEDPKFKQHVQEFANDQTAFFVAFTQAWVKLQENGCDALRDVL